LSGRRSRARRPVSTEYPPMDQPAWRSHLSNALATGPKHLPLLSQVLSGKLRKVTTCPKKSAVRAPMDQRIRSFLADVLALAGEPIGICVLNADLHSTTANAECGSSSVMAKRTTQPNTEQDHRKRRA
jgi:hypothetical protein